MTRRRALVAGATGVVATRLVELLAGDPDWEVVGLCRRPPARPDAYVRYVTADLLKPDGRLQQIEELGAITHLFYLARAPHSESGVEPHEENVAMLRALLDVLEERAPRLKHVHLVQGGKYYGMHLGPYRTPAREDDPRLLPSNFYYGQQDLLETRQRGRAWTFSIARPPAVTDYAPGRARNLVSILGVYAVICREMRIPLYFPGDEACFAALTECVEAPLLARAMRWMASEPRCANQAFNITNGDAFRWCNLWPELARRFGLDPGPARPTRLAEVMVDKAPVWESAVRRHGLKPRPFEEVALWSFADFALSQGYDVLSSTVKARAHGFELAVETHAMVFRILDRYRDEGLI